MPRVSQLVHDRNRLAQFFDRLGNEDNIPDETIKLVRLAFTFGELCKELEIIEGRKLFEGDEE